MGKNVLSLTVLVILLIANFSITGVAKNQPLSLYPSDLINEGSTYLLLANKWESGKIYLDLTINGTFEGNIDGNNSIYGNWEITNNQKTLILVNDPIDEEEFKIEYTLSDVSFGSIKLTNKEGKTFILKRANK